MIAFSIRASCSLPPEQICKAFFDADSWSSFVGYGPLPGVKRAVKEAPHDAKVGTIFYVENTDGSTHKETVEAYDPGKRIAIRMDCFSPPLRSMATHFTECWEFAESDAGCQLIRTFELHPTNKLSTVPLWIISRLLKKAVEIHTSHVTNPKNA